MEEKEIKEVAAEAAVVDNAANTAANVEPAEAAANLLEQVLDTTKDARSRQAKTFGRHWSGSQSLAVIKKGAKDTLKDFQKWQSNLEALLKEIEQQESADFLQGVADNADNLTPEAIQKVIDALQAKKAAKAV